MPDADSTMQNRAIVGASVVVFYPAMDVFEALIRSLILQVHHVVVVDNGGLTPWKHEQVEIIVPAENIGVAGGHNMAVRRLEQLECSHVVLFDQDSLPEPNMVSKLLELTLNELRLAAVGPSFFDPRSQHSLGRPYQEGCTTFEIKATDSPDALQKCTVENYLITSGSLIPLRAWRQIGSLKESFFIDYVDVEWGLRAKALGFKSLKAKKAKMAHLLGDRIAKPLGLSFVIHSPSRTYFQVRNRVWLYRFSTHSLAWKTGDALRLVLRIAFNLIAVQERYLRMKMISRGLYDGLTGRLGPYRPE